MELRVYTVAYYGQVFVQNNNIYYKPSIDEDAVVVAGDGTPNTLNGVPDKLYKGA